LVSGQVVTAAIGVVGVGITTRYLGVANFGSFAAASGLISLLTLLADVGFTSIGAREIARRPDQQGNILGALLLIALLTTVVAAAIGIAAVKLLYTGDGHALTRHGISWLMLALPLGALSATQHAVLVAHQRVYVTVLGTLTGALCSLAGMVASVAADWGFDGVIGAFLVSYLIAVMVQGVGLARSRARPKRPGPGLVGHLARAALPVAIAGVATAIFVRADLILLSLLSTKVAVGNYAVAYKIIDGLAIIPAAITVTLLPRLSVLSPQSPAARRLVQSIVSTSTAAAGLVVAMLLALAPAAIKILGGDGFHRGAQDLRILAVGLGIAYLAAAFGGTLVAFDAQRKLSLLALVTLGVNLSVNMVLIPSLGDAGAAAGYLVSQVAGLAVILWAYRRIAPLPSAKGIGAVVTSAVGAGGLAFAIAAPLAQTPLAAAIAALVGSVAYLTTMARMDALPIDPRSVLSRWR